MGQKTKRPSERVSGAARGRGIAPKSAAHEKSGHLGADRETGGHKSATHRTAEQKTAVQKRLSRIEGQVRGLSRMLEDGRYCIDIVTQIAAVRAALRRVEEEILRDHVAHCVHGAIVSGNRAEQRSKIDELMQVLVRAER